MKSSHLLLVALGGAALALVVYLSLDDRGTPAALEQGAAARPVNERAGDGTDLAGVSGAEGPERAAAGPDAVEAGARESGAPLVALAPHDADAPTRALEVEVVPPAGVEDGEPFEVFVLARRLGPGRLSASVELDDPRDARGGPGSDLIDLAPPDELPSSVRAAILARAPATRDADGALRARFVVAADRDHWVHARGPRATTLEPPRVRADDAPPGEALTLRLEPALWAHLDVRLTGSPERSGVRASLAGDSTRDLGTALAPGKTSGLAERHRRSDPDGALSFAAVPPGRALELRLRPEDAATETVRIDPLEPGERRALDLELRVGASVSGTVTLPDGAPAPGAVVQASRKGRAMGFDDEVLREARADAEGRFVLAGLDSGALRLRADADGWLHSANVDVALGPEEVQRDVALELREGRVVRGTARFDGGAPAEGAEVHARFDAGHMMGAGAMSYLKGRSGAAVVGADGRFTLGGLGAGPFVLTVEAAPSGAQEGATPWRARADGVRSKAEPAEEREGEGVELVLRPPLALAGQVVADLSDAVGGVRVTALRITEGALGDFEQRRVDGWSARDGGRFELTDLDAGEWTVLVQCDTHVTLSPLEVTVPADGGAPLELVAHRAATARGWVRSPLGGAASGARVGVASDGPDWAAPLRKRPATARTEAAEDGAFELRGLAPGRITLEADADTFGSAPPTTLELAPGELREDVVIVLAAGGVLTGEVYGPDGSPAAGRMVTAQGADMNQGTPTATDDDGRFRFEGLDPGRYQVVAIDLARMGEAGESAQEGLDVAGIMSAMEMATVEVLEGETVHVVLGAPPADPVVVAGTVTRAGEPHVGATVSFFPTSSKLYERLSAAQVDATGAYELTLDEPGDYVVAVQRVGGGVGQQSTVEFRAVVPDVERHELDFVVPGGRISGVVRDEEGRPVAGARVTLARDGGVRTDLLMGGNMAEVITEGDGSYALEGLRAATYRVSAGGASLLGTTTRGALGRVTRAGLALAEDEARADVDLVLPQPGALTVRVVGADGQPRAGATVFVRDAAGLPLESLSLIQTGQDGRAVVEGLAPGTYTASARTSAEAAADGAPVRVRVGETAATELRLEEGTILRIKLALKGEGEVPPASLRVLDPDGRDVSSSMGITDLQSLYMDDAFSRTEHRLGPLAPGRYTVEASSGALEGRRSVTLRGGEERSVTVVLR